MTANEILKSERKVVKANFLNNITAWIDSIIERLNSLIKLSNKMVQDLISFDEVVRLLQMSSEVLSINIIY